MNRREFALSLAVLAPLLRRAPVPTATGERRLKRVGLELYGVRTSMKRDPERTLAAIRAIGYLDVELLWSLGNFGRTPAQVKASLDAEGLKAPSAHIQAEFLTNDWERSLADAKLLGHEYLIVPSLPASGRTTLDGWRLWADRFNTAGAAARRSNLWLAFHNEPDDMRPIDARVPYDVFVERLDPQYVRLQLDVGNMAMGGSDPMVYLKRHLARYWSFHVKDVIPDRTRDTGLGKGIVNLQALLAAIPEIDRRPCYVEQEGATDDLAAARADFVYLSTLEF
ncbi:MAG: sugar phosphate isomerase/epimerase family protein [Gemmatimonadaceae bacterium]